METTLYTAALGLILGIAVILYVVLDGFDLGVGILLPFAPDDAARDRMVDTVAPVWDGNETWLVLGGGGLLAAFPLAFAVLGAALYIPLLLMLLALIFRGVAFEFRLKARKRGFWNWAFTGGSLVAAFSQGVVLGGLVQGVELENGIFYGGSLDFASPYVFLTGIGVVAGYALMGATWLVWRFDGPLQRKARVWARIALLATIGAMGVVSLANLLLQERIRERWLEEWTWVALSPLPIAAGLLALWAWRSLGRATSHVRPFLLTIGVFLTGALGLGASLWPYVIPPGLTLQDASTHPDAQAFLLVAILVVLPFILAYTAYVYWIFRGKVKEDDPRLYVG